MRSVWGFGAGVVAAAFLTGCATLVEPMSVIEAQSSNTPIRVLLTTPITELEARADSDRIAAAALSLGYRYGMRDLPVDMDRAEDLWRKALRPVPATVITQYIPGVNGAPGRTVPIVIPSPNYETAFVRNAEVCAKVLERDPSVVTRDEYIEDIDENALATCGAPEHFSMLNEVWREARGWRNYPFPECDVDDERCVGIARKIDRLNARDPAAEASSAAAAGDFRLGAAQTFGPLPASGWRLPGIRCDGWAREQIRFWHISSDYIEPGDDEHQQASEAFIAAYNRALVQTDAFPHKDICAPAMQRRAPAYLGPVTGWPEFARAGISDAIAPTGDIEAKDFLGYTALRWASERGNSAMILRLLEEGAAPAYEGENALNPSPLAMALQRRDNAVVDALIARGATVGRIANFCDLYEYNQRHCTWAGLMALAGRQDLWAKIPTEIGGEGLYSEFSLALKNSDESALAFALPAMPDRTAVLAMNVALKSDRPDLVMGLAAHAGMAAARSQTEARIWRAAVEGQHASALVYLYQSGKDLNLLSAQRVEDCVQAASRGDVAALEACVGEATAKRQSMVAQLDAGDLAGFKAAIVEIADWDERNKQTMLGLAAAKADVEAVELLMARGAKVNPPHIFFASDDIIQVSSGDNVQSIIPPIQTAYDRRDVPLMRVLGPHDGGSLHMRLMSDALKDGRDFSSFEESRDLTPFVNRPEPEAMQLLEAFIPIVAQGEKAQFELSNLYLSAARKGFEDVMQLIVDNGLVLRDVADPGAIWSSWSGNGTPCKPSTGQMLLRHGLPLNYEPKEVGAYSPVRQVVTTCRNPDSLSVLLDAGADLNAVDAFYGETALDAVGTMVYRAQMRAEIVRRGGKTALEVDPEGHSRRKTQSAQVTDPDLN